MAENGVGSGIDPNTIAMLKKMNVDLFAELRANTNQKDCDVVKAYEKAIVSVMIEMDQINAGLASETQESAQSAEAQFKELNEKATKVKNAIDEFSKSKGDCGFIYKNADKTAKAYTKKEPTSRESLIIHVQDNIVLFLPVTTKGKVEFKFTWKEPEIKKVTVSIPDYAASDVETTEMSKTGPATITYLNRKRRKFISVPVTITNIEMYEASDKNSTAREYVISTKEGKVIHLWQKWSGNNWTTKVNFNGLKDASTWKWGETGGN